jgi:hypothetical protein
MPDELVTLNPYQPISVARDHLGRVLIANGINTMRLWNGVQAIREAGVPTPANGSFAGVFSGSGSITGLYYFAVRFVDEFGDVGSLSTLVTATASSDTTITYSDIPDGDSRVSKVQIWRSLAGDPAVLYLDVEKNNDFIGNATSTKSDATLAAGQQLPILNADGTLHARRFDEPPADKAFLAAFKDRIWAAGDVRFDKGHVTHATGVQDTGSVTAATNASPIQITSNLHGLLSGTRITISGVGGNTAANGTFIITVVDNNNFTLNGTTGNGAYTSGGSWTTTYLTGSIYGDTDLDEGVEGRSLWLRGASASFDIIQIVPGEPTTFTANTLYGIGTTATFSKYALSPASELANRIFYSELLEPLSWPQSQNYVSLSDDLGDFITGLMPHGNYLYILKERHIYRLSYTTVPALDGEVALVASRGCVNHRCWVQIEDAVYLLDYDGIYAFNGSSVQTLSIPIQNTFREGAINWGSAKWFHAAHDAAEEVIRFFVCLGDSRYPKHAICFNYRLNRWWRESYVFAVGSSCQAVLNGRMAPLYGRQDFRFATPGGTLDGINGDDPTWRGTVTSATLTSLTDSNVTQPSAAPGAAVVIVSGRGKGQKRIVSTVSGGRINVNYPWSIIPDPTSVYQIGGIDWRVRLGKYIWPAVESYTKRAFTFWFQPTQFPASFDVRHYLSHHPLPARMQRDGVHGLLTTTVNDPDAVIDMQHERTEGGVPSYSPGLERIDLSAAADQQIPTDRAVSIELRGVQGVDPIVLGQISMEGLKRKGNG